MTTIIYNYQIYCNTEETFIGGYGTEAPTACYHNDTHEINPNSIQLLSQFSPQTVIISEEDTPTGGHYGAAAFHFTAAPLTTTSFDSSFPYIVSMLAAQLQVSTDMIGDSVDFSFAPNTTIGVLTTNHAVDDTVLHVSPTVIANLHKGFTVTVTNGVQTNICGRVVSIDSTQSTITVETPLAYAFTTGSYVQLTRYFLQNYYLSINGIHTMGFCKIGGGATPAGTTGRCTYTNNSSTEKIVSFVIEHLY